MIRHMKITAKVKIKYYIQSSVRSSVIPKSPKEVNTKSLKIGSRAEERTSSNW
jgi:hypothetical protein